MSCGPGHLPRGPGPEAVSLTVVLEDAVSLLPLEDSQHLITHNAVIVTQTLYELAMVLSL